MPEQVSLSSGHLLLPWFLLCKKEMMPPEQSTSVLMSLELACLCGKSHQAFPFYLRLLN